MKKGLRRLGHISIQKGQVHRLVDPLILHTDDRHGLCVLVRYQMQCGLNHAILFEKRYTLVGVAGNVL